MIKNSIGDRNTFRKLHVKSFQELKVRFSLTVFPTVYTDDRLLIKIQALKSRSNRAEHNYHSLFKCCLLMICYVNSNLTGTRNGSDVLRQETNKYVSISYPCMCLLLYFCWWTYIIIWICLKNRCSCYLRAGLIIL